MRLELFMLCAGVALFCAPAQAQDTQDFFDLDRNGDARIGLDESQINPRLVRNFYDVDLNRDGAISIYEFGIFFTRDEAAGDKAAERDLKPKPASFPASASEARAVDAMAVTPPATVNGLSAAVFEENAAATAMPTRLLGDRVFE